MTAAATSAALAAALGCVLATLPTAASAQSTLRACPAPLLTDAAVDDLIDTALGPDAALADALRAQAVVIAFGQSDHEACATVARAGTGRGALYPASQIKLPAALAAFAHMNALAGAPVDPDTAVAISALEVTLDGQPWTVRDATSGTVGRWVDEALGRSSNTAYNALFEIADPAFANPWLASLGGPPVCVVQRLSQGHLPLGVQAWVAQWEARWEAPSEGLEGARTTDEPFIRFAEHRCEQVCANADHTAQAGLRYIDGVTGATVEQPLNLASRNQAQPEALAWLMAALMRPDAFTTDPLAALSTAQRERVANAMRVDSAALTDDAVAALHPLLAGALAAQPDAVGASKVGVALGFVGEVAWIDAGDTQMVVAAGAFVDRDGTLNDDAYAYEAIGLPWLGAVGAGVLGITP